MKNTIKFDKNLTALFVSVALHTMVNCFQGVFKINTFIIILWALVDLVLVYRVAASMSKSKAK